MASKKPAGVSSKLMGLKFMQRAQAKEDLGKKKEEQAKAQQEEKFVLENKQKGCVVLEDDFTTNCSGRFSFMNYNPEVERINQEHQERAKQAAVEVAEQDDVSAKEMSQVLGKRKQLPAGSIPAVDHQTNEEATMPRGPSPNKSPKTNHQQRKQREKESEGHCCSQDGERDTREGRKLAGKSSGKPGKSHRSQKKSSGVPACEPRSLTATAAEVS